MGEILIKKLHTLILTLPYLDIKGSNINNFLPK